MPFDIERIYFDRRGEYTTAGRHLQIITLTVGHKVTIRSKTNPESVSYTHLDVYKRQVYGKDGNTYAQY